MTSDPVLPAAIAWTRTAAVASTVALLLLCVAWELWLAPTGSGTLAIKAVPLIFPIAGLARLRLYTYRGTSLLVWPYVAEGLVRATTEHGSGAVLAVLEVVLASVLFIACAAHVRARLRNGAPIASAAP